MKRDTSEQLLTTEMMKLCKYRLYSVQSWFVCYYRVVQIFQKSKSHLKIPGTRRVT